MQVLHLNGLNENPSQKLNNFYLDMRINEMSMNDERTIIGYPPTFRLFLHHNSNMTS